MIDWLHIDNECACPSLALLRHAYRPSGCLLLKEDRKSSADNQTDAMDPERTSALMTRRHSSARAVADLRPPVRCDERVNLNPSAAILLKTCFQASKGGRASA